jgi:hypothetical protein
MPGGMCGMLDRHIDPAGGGRCLSPAILGGVWGFQTCGSNGGGSAGRGSGLPGGRANWRRISSGAGTGLLLRGRVAYSRFHYLCNPAIAIIAMILAAEVAAFVSRLRHRVALSP